MCGLVLCEVRYMNSKIKPFNERWLSLSSDAGDSYVRYDDISLFIYSEKNKSIKIYVKGIDREFVFGFSDLAELRGTRDLLIEHL